MNTTKYTLKYPLQWGDETITELEFRRPRGKDIFDLKGDNPTPGDLAKIASRLSGKELPIFKELDIDDFVAVLEIVGNFIGSSQKTGDNPGL